MRSEETEVTFTWGECRQGIQKTFIEQESHDTERLQWMEVRVGQEKKSPFQIWEMVGEERYRGRAGTIMNEEQVPL